MRLLIVGQLQGQLGAATKIAMDRGAKVTHADRHRTGSRNTARRARRRSRAVRRQAATSASWCAALPAERICTPVVACGIGTDARRAVDAIRAGAKEYLPLPPDPELIAAVLAAVADDSHQLIYDDPAMDAVIALADQVAGSRSLDPDHRRERHGQGSAGPLRPPQVRARRQAVHLGELRRDPREPAGIGTVRPREGRLHRRRRAAHRQVRGGQWRHAAARRNQRDGCPPAGQAAARHPGARDRPCRRHQAGQGRHPHHRHLEPRSCRCREARHLPRGPALPAQRREPAPAAAARAAQGHPGARRAFRAQICRGQWRALPRRSRRRPNAFSCRIAWRGNVRELENTIHRAVLLATGAEIEPEAIRLPDGTQVGPGRTGDLPAPVQAA